MRLSRRMLLQSAAAGAFALNAPALATPDHPGIDDYFNVMADLLLAASPETASSLGLDKGARAALKSQLGDRSWDAVKASHAACALWQARLAQFPTAQMPPGAALDRDVVSYALQLGIDSAAFDFGDNTLASAMGESSTPYVISQQSGNLVGIPEFLNSQHRIETKADADAYLARLEVFAISLDQETARVVRDSARGVIPPDFLLRTAIGQMTRFRAAPAAGSKLVLSLATRTKAKGIEGDYAASAETIVTDKIYPAVSRQLAALTAAAANATSHAGVWKLRLGEEYYAWCLKVGTTTSQTPAEIHQTGLEQNAAIMARMDALLKAQGLTTGSVGARMAALGQDPNHLFADTDAGRDEALAYLTQLIADTRLVMPKISRLNLKAPVIARRVPVDIQDGAGLGYMNTGSLDGSRPSTYYINLKTTRTWPKFAMPTLTHHETIPGHAWQGAYLTETGNLPLIRILLSGFNAYVEGWALYAEQLSDEIGLYDDDPFARLGYLQAQQFRACRLVVDTGLHAMRWTRDEAVRWMVEQTGRTQVAITSEVDRYCGTPGQACGYKVGHNEILRLRDKAKAALGARFDLRDFDDWVVEAGAVPLTVLASVIDGKIA
ncbi:MAG TPA: DUF885 family protein [Rhizomicrobium sp.]